MTGVPREGGSPPEPPRGSPPGAPRGNPPEPPGGSPPEPPHRPRARRLVAALLGLMVAATVAGHAFTPLLFRESPVLLLGVLSAYPQMALASARIDPVTFVLVAAVRRWAGEVVAFAAGRVFGEQGVAQFEQRTGRRYDITGLVNSRWSGIRDALVLLVPHPLLSAAVGAAGMPTRRFVVLKFLGSLGSVTLIWYLAGAAASPIELAAAYVERYALALTAVGVVVAALWAAARYRRAPNADAETPEA